MGLGAQPPARTTSKSTAGSFCCDLETGVRLLSWTQSLYQVEKKQYNYSQVERWQIVEDYYSKKITSAQLASEYSLDVSVIHRWKYESDRRKKTERKNELISESVKHFKTSCVVSQIYPLAPTG